MEYIEIFDKISLGTLITVVLALLFLGGLIMKGLEKYRKLKNAVEQKDKDINKHESEIVRINGDVSEIKEKIDTVIDSLNQVSENADKREARRLRREILKFSDGIRDGKTYSKDAFQDIIESNEEYRNIITRRNINNGFTEHEMLYILKKYDELYGG